MVVAAEAGGGVPPFWPGPIRRFRGRGRHLPANPRGGGGGRTPGRLDPLAPPCPPPKTQPPPAPASDKAYQDPAAPGAVDVLVRGGAWTQASTPPKKKKNPRAPDMWVPPTSADPPGTQASGC